MAIVSGTAGSVVIGGTAGTAVGNMREWTMSLTHNIVDAGAFGIAWEQFIPGIKGATGTFSGNFDASDAQQVAVRNHVINGTEFALLLAAGTVRFNIGTAYSTSFDTTIALDGRSDLAFNWTASGPVTIV